MKKAIVHFLILFAVATVPVPSKDLPNERIPIVARGEKRAEIKSIDILERPNRPMHVYGNTVRRRAMR